MEALTRYLGVVLRESFYRPTQARAYRGHRSDHRAGDVDVHRRGNRYDHRGVQLRARNLVHVHARLHGLRSYGLAYRRQGLLLILQLCAHRHGHRVGDVDGHRGDNRRDLHALRRCDRNRGHVGVCDLGACYIRS